VINPQANKECSLPADVDGQKYGEEKMKKILWTLVLTLAVTACDKKSENQGGVDSSGGDLSFMPFDEFQGLAKEVFNSEVSHILYRISHLRTTSNEADFQAPEVGLLLQNYKDQPNILKSTKLIVSPGPCIGDGVHRDGSANIEDSSICVSYPAFKRLNKRAAYGSLGILMIHEISHLLGLNEEQCVSLQKVLEKRHQQYNSLFLFDLDYLNRYEKDAIEIHLSLNKLSRQIAHGNPLKICSAQALTFEQLLILNSGSSGASTISGGEFKKIWPLWKKISEQISCEEDLPSFTLEQRKILLTEISELVGIMNRVSWLVQKFQHPSTVWADWRSENELRTLQQSFAEIITDPSAPIVAQIEKSRCEIRDLNSNEVIAQLHGREGINIPVPGLSPKAEAVVFVGDSQKWSLYLNFSVHGGYFIRSTRDGIHSNTYERMQMFYGPYLPTRKTILEFFSYHTIGAKEPINSVAPSARLEVECQYL
jgi:hypothetical protein